ncbi:hypothetical protein [Vibrio metschnikovii]|uniref:Uncharacterized protein n=1 Tax=Vibrio metschnikovii TaxID=28172 RepID=A0A9X0RBR2_VIBME|nr:hypothetical protein [Vibrio metschnikovii]MBC5853092.1 hypothetical protein [Vibrio metschnikovii]
MKLKIHADTIDLHVSSIANLDSNLIFQNVRDIIESEGNLVRNTTVIINQTAHEDSVHYQLENQINNGFIIREQSLAYLIAKNYLILDDVKSMINIQGQLVELRLPPDRINNIFQAYQNCINTMVDYGIKDPSVNKSFDDKIHVFKISSRKPDAILNPGKLEELLLRVIVRHLKHQFK